MDWMVLQEGFMDWMVLQEGFMDWMVLQGARGPHPGMARVKWGSVREWSVTHTGRGAYGGSPAGCVSREAWERGGQGFYGTRFICLWM